MGQKLGYRRVSTPDQSFARQDLGEVDKMFEEKVSGVAKVRPQLEALIAHIRPGDEVVIHSIDRIGRNLVQIKANIERMNAAGADVRFIKNELTFPASGSTSTGRMILGIFGTIAEFERDLLLDRQMEGIYHAKKEGKFKGKQRTLDAEAILKTARMRDPDGKGYTRKEIAQKHKISVATVYNILREDREARSQADTSDNNNLNE